MEILSAQSLIQLVQFSPERLVKAQNPVTRFDICEMYDAKGLDPGKGFADA